MNSIKRLHIRHLAICLTTHKDHISTPLSVTLQPAGMKTVGELSYQPANGDSPGCRELPAAMHHATTNP